MKRGRLAALALVVLALLWAPVVAASHSHGRACGACVAAHSPVLRGPAPLALHVPSSLGWHLAWEETHGQPGRLVALLLSRAPPA